MGFAFIGVLAFGGVAKHFDQDHGDPPLVWGSFPLFSMGLAVGVAVLVGYFVEGLLTWPIGGFMYTIAYLLAAAAESALAYWLDYRREE